jgi:hypothetical protein
MANFLNYLSSIISLRIYHYLYHKYLDIHLYHQMLLLIYHDYLEYQMWLNLQNMDLFLILLFMKDLKIIGYYLLLNSFYLMCYNELYHF